MAGIVIPVFCIRTWTFTGLKVGAGNAEEYCIQKNLPVGHYREASLMVRAHSVSILDGASKIEVRVVEEAPTPEEPATDFEGAELASGRIISATQAPTLVQSDLSAPFGAFVTVYVKGTQGSAGSSVSAELSAELVLKE